MPKKMPLVCQHLEGISRAALEKYQDIVRAYVRHREGVYALYHRGKLYYVGLASDLRWRLRHHLKDRHKKGWDSFSIYLTIGNKHIKELESLLLRVIKPKPKGNGQSGKFVSSENLVRRFKKDIRAHHRRELDALIGRESRDSKAAEVADRTELARLMQGRDRLHLRARYKGKTYKARIRQDGMIRFNGKLYRSPSAAGIAVVGRACNGWRFWQVERAPADWVELRRIR